MNDQLLQGPDLTNSLVGVLTRFREEPVAFMSDVESMFYQVHVRSSDCDALRFLWWPDGDLDRAPEEFQMNVHLFGGASSPSCASFALRKTAEDYKTEFDPITAETVRRNFYVDDCLKSLQSDAKVIQLASQLREMLAKGGFRLTRWISNSKEVINTLMCEVESIVNGRPLTKVSDDPHDLEALTPNHLLLLNPGSSFPPGRFSKEDNCSRRRWRQVQYLADVFWRRWIREYLPSLQPRQKWNEKCRNVKVEDIVLVVDEKTPRSSWPLARVSQVNANRKDGLVRSVKVKTSTAVLIRPISKIVLLEEASTSDDK